jgi:hypothetical protein
MKDAPSPGNHGNQANHGHQGHLQSHFDKLKKVFGARVAQYSVWLDWMTGVRSPTEAEDFSSNLCVQTGSGAHPASCTMGTGGPFPRGKARPGRDADHSPPSSTEVKNE